MRIFTSNNPTHMYLLAWNEVAISSSIANPRGKKIKEMRPVCFEFLNPYNRVTFVEGRRINPFFQLAESLWIVSGRSDVNWLEHFNATIGQFSDDGEYFNAPYGERMRYWNKNDAHSIIINPIDQLYDAYKKLLTDRDTRQAVIVLYNPMFDNSRYTIGEKGKDICCNLIFTFKIRDNKLYMTVFNRSNDIHWGLFGANLCQFSTIHELMLSFLRNNDEGVDYSTLTMGTYTHITDSLHMYIEDYGAKAIDEYPPAQEYCPVFETEKSPRMNLSFHQFSEFLGIYWNHIDEYLMDDEYLLNSDCSVMFDKNEGYLDALKQCNEVDDYWCFVTYSMLAYRFVKLHKLWDALRVLSELPNCDWKVSMLHFLKKFIQNATDDVSAVKNMYQYQVHILCEDFPNDTEFLLSYLRLPE